MKVSIFQPTYLPWLGFLKAIEWADKFVILDDVQFENHSWQSRNRIKSASRGMTLTIPIVRKFPQAINQVKINYSRDWVNKHLKTIKLNYSKTSFFKDYFYRLEPIYNKKPERLIDLTVAIIKDICEFLRIKTVFYYSSDLGAGELRKNEKIIAILKKLEADKYLYAAGARDYMQEALAQYSSNNIKLIPLRFEHPRYKQPGGEFISHLSIIDIIFNCGRRETMAMLKNIKLSNQ